MGDYPGEPSVTTRVLIRGMQKGHSQRRGCAKRSRERERDVMTQEAEKERGWSCYAAGLERKQPGNAGAC